MIKKNSTGAAVFTIGCLLLGGALAAPLKLNLYFSDRPAIDILIDGLLLLTAFLIAYRWSKCKGLWWIYLIPFIGIIWLPFDYIAYSKSEWWAVVSYLIIVWWGSSLVVLWRYGQTLFQDQRKLILGGIALMLGLAFGMYGDWTLIGTIGGCFYLILSGLTAMSSGNKLMPASLASILIVIIITGALLIPPPQYFESQKKHHDKVVFSQQTRFQTLDVTEWKGNYWFYQDNINHYSSIDSWLYFEPFVHPAMQLVQGNGSVLIIGGENGMLAKYLKQYASISIDLIPIDREFLEVAKSNELYTQQNEGVLEESLISILDESVFHWLNNKAKSYDLIMVDVPDPIDIELNQYYTKEFYQLCHRALKKNGLIVTQSGSPYFATAAFQSIEKTMESAEFSTASFHNQVLTLGEWGWTLGSKSALDLKSALKQLTFSDIETQWLNAEAMQMMLSFGKSYVSNEQAAVNTIKNPVIYRLYNQGNYQLN